jgi:hypothetical protein
LAPEGLEILLPFCHGHVPMEASHPPPPLAGNQARDVVNGRHAIGKHHRALSHPPPCHPFPQDGCEELLPLRGLIHRLTAIMKVFTVFYWV